MNAPVRPCLGSQVGAAAQTLQSHPRAARTVTEVTVSDIHPELRSTARVQTRVACEFSDRQCKVLRPIPAD